MVAAKFDKLTCAGREICHQKLKKNGLPALALANILFSGDIPQELRGDHVEIMSHRRVFLSVRDQAIIKPLVENLIRNTTAKIYRLPNKVVVVVGINFSDDICSTGSMKHSGNRKVQVAEGRIRAIDHSTTRSTIESDHIPICSIYCCTSSTYLTKSVCGLFPIIVQRLNSLRSNKTVHLPISLDSLNAPLKCIK